MFKFSIEFNDESLDFLL